MANTTHPHANYRVILRDGTQIDVLPTPRLIQAASEASSRGRWVEAYESDPATDRYPPVWRLRDDSYDPAFTAYEMVVRIEEVR